MYRYPNEKNWYCVEAASSRNSPMLVNMNHIIKKNHYYEILIYGPILSNIKEIKVEMSENYEIEYCENKINESILVTGGMHSFGIGCTVAGTMFSNILGRKLNTNIYNISFNEKNYLKHIYNYFKDKNYERNNITLLELDYYQQDEEIFDKYYEKIIKILKNNCDFLICWYCIPLTSKNKHDKLKEIAKKYLNEPTIQIIDLSFIYNKDFSEMCTYSNKFINDTGNIMIYKKLEDIITETTKGDIKWKI